MNKNITENKLKEYNEFYDNNLVSKIATNALSKSSIDNVCFNTLNASKMNYKFSIEIPTMKVTNQKSTGRCWLFAALNVLREGLAKKLNVEDIEISQSYISFYDKLEKANYFLETIIETGKHPVDDRLVNWILKSPISDGGQWDMFVSLVKKYGVVPKEAMPETYQSGNTGSMNKIINTKLREDAIRLRSYVKDDVDMAVIEQRKGEMLKEVYNILCTCLGRPADKFNFEYVDKNKEYHLDENLTPKAFYDKYIGINLENYVSIINAPTDSKPFNRVYTVRYLGNVIEAEPILYLNLDLPEFKKIVVEQLKNKELVWFGCDTGKFGSREEGIWDVNIYDYDTPFSIKTGMTKGDMLDYNQSSMGHAMVITGVNILENGEIDKWKIENSWGEEKGNKGYYIMSDVWFDRYVYQACVNTKYLTNEQKNILSQTTLVLEPWDPMGTLA